MQVCAGHVHTLALTEDGEVFAWGNNKTGCVGCEERGTCAPQRVEGLKGKRVVAEEAKNAECLYEHFLGVSRRLAALLGVQLNYELLVALFEMMRVEEL